jgi:capsular exopolysaccharide synthesis family protein
MNPRRRNTTDDRDAAGAVRVFNPEQKSGKGERQKYAVGVPLAKLIKRKLTKAPELVMLHDTRSVPAEKFRRLKTVLANEAEESPQVIVVTSATPSEGKTLVSTNLALAFAADRRGDVLLLDADLRRPSVGRWLSPVPTLGLTEILSGKIEIDHAILELENSPLKILPGGAPARDAVELLSSDSAREMLATLRRRFARIIIDTPPIVPFTDADILGGLSDGVIVVARARSTPQAMLLQALSAVTSTRILGMVLNDTTFSLADRDNYYVDKQYYQYYHKQKRR